MQSWIFSIITLQCHMIFQKSFKCADLILKKHFLLLTMLKTLCLIFFKFNSTYLKYKYLSMLYTSALSLYCHNCILVENKSGKKNLLPQNFEQQCIIMIRIVIIIIKLHWTCCSVRQDIWYGYRNLMYSGCSPLCRWPLLLWTWIWDRTHDAPWWTETAHPHPRHQMEALKRDRERRDSEEERIL